VASRVLSVGCRPIGFLNAMVDGAAKDGYVQDKLDDRLAVSRSIGLWLIICMHFLCFSHVAWPKPMACQLLSACCTSNERSG